MKKIALLSLALLVVAASAGAQTLSPIVDGHVRRTQTVHYDPANPSNQFCSRPNNCVATFVYIDKIYVGGQNAYADPDPAVPVLYWEDSRAVFEFDISAVPASAAATLNFTTVDNFYPPAPDTPLAVTVYRLSAADSNGVLTNCDFNAAGGGYDSKRWITAGCSNLVQQPSAGGLSLDTVTFPKSWSLDVTSALAAAKGAGQTRLGLAIAGNQGIDPATDTNFDGDELRVAHSTEASGPTLVVSALAPGISLSDISCPGTTPGTPVSIPVTIRSVGSGPLTITGVSLRADSDTCHAFTLDTTGMQTTIPSGGQTTFDITFSPTVAGTCSVLLVVTSNDPDTPTVEREVSCTATTGPTAKISVSPASNSCGPIPVGSTTSTTITVANTGSATLTLTGVTELADPASAFSATAAGLPASLAPGASAGFVVTFAPTAAGTFSAAYQVESNATNPAGGRVDFSCSASACTSGGGPAVSVVPGSGSCQPTPVGGVPRPSSRSATSAALRCRSRG